MKMDTSIQRMRESIDQELAAYNDTNKLQHRRTTRKPTFCRFKLGIKFLDQVTKPDYVPHHSYDYYHHYEGSHRHSILDERKGLTFLRREILKQIRLGKVATAYIYVTLGSTDTQIKDYDYEIAHFSRGKGWIWAPIKWLELHQLEIQEIPRRSKIETQVDLDKLQLFFKELNHQKLVDAAGNPYFHRELIVIAK